jgi:hypothetical protein
MSYDLIESTLIRLGEEMRERLPASYQSRELPSGRCDTKQRSAASSVGRSSFLSSRPLQKPERASHEKDDVC